MPYILIQVTKEGVTPEQKRTLIRGATDLVVTTLQKEPATTFVVIEEVETDNWGVAGQSTTELRQAAKRKGGS
jgi:4-oxalocrotonate tautomerase